MITCALGDLPSGATATIVITVRPTAPGTLHNEATTTSGRPDPTPDDNRAAVDTTVEVLTDLAITKTASSQTAIVGEHVIFTIVATNHGPSAATNVVVSDPLPAGLTFVSATTDHGSCAAAGSTVTCNLGNLPAGASATITIEATRTTTDAIANTATLSGGEKDPDGGNNTSTASLRPSRGEDCGNCVDDDGNGQVDSEDSACCEPEPLTVTQAQYRPGRSTLRVTRDDAGRDVRGRRSAEGHDPAPGAHRPGRDGLLHAPARAMAAPLPQVVRLLRSEDDGLPADPVREAHDAEEGAAPGDDHRRTGEARRPDAVPARDHDQRGEPVRGGVAHAEAEGPRPGGVPMRRWVPAIPGVASSPGAASDAAFSTMGKPIGAGSGGAPTP